ncbi:MAG: hypothetical protein NVS3B10_02600 [Polyangiales bacterium]
MSEHPLIVLGTAGKPPLGPPAHPAPASKRPPEQTFGAVLRALGEETRRGERLVERASSGGVPRDVSAGELIALQAGVYRYVEVVDLASKLVDRVAQGAKSLVQGGGQ